MLPHASNASLWVMDVHCVGAGAGAGAVIYKNITCYFSEPKKCICWNHTRSHAYIQTMIRDFECIKQNEWIKSRVHKTFHLWVLRYMMGICYWLHSLGDTEAYVWEEKISVFTHFERQIKSKWSKTLDFQSQHSLSVPCGLYTKILGRVFLGMSH